MIPPVGERSKAQPTARCWDDETSDRPESWGGDRYPDGGAPDGCRGSRGGERRFFEEEASLGYPTGDAGGRQRSGYGGGGAERGSMPLSAGLEAQLSGMEETCKQALRKMAMQRTKKFDLIFGILSELKSRQSSLEESIGSLAPVQHGAASSSSGAMPMPSHGGPQEPQYGGSSYGSVPMSPQSMQLNMVGQQPVQQGMYAMPQAGASQSPQLGFESRQVGLALTAPSPAEATSAWQPHQPAPATWQGQEPPPEDGKWEKHRVWKAANLAPSGGRIAVLVTSEPHAPGRGREPSPSRVVAWLQEGDLVQQVGHSKKVRNHMVMPVKLLSKSPLTAPEADAGAPGADGWVTRRIHAGPSWFEEQGDGRMMQ